MIECSLLVSKNFSALVEAIGQMEMSSNGDRAILETDAYCVDEGGEEGNSCYLRDEENL
jgi:hypothetical protein